MFKLLILVLQIVGVCLLGAAPVYWWDRHPPIGFHAHVLWWHPGFDLPDSLSAQRDKALAAVASGQAALSQCHTNTEALKAAVEAQNSAVDALKAQGDTMKAENARAVSSARAVAESERQRAADILAQQSSDPDRCRAADALILKEAGR